MVTEEWVQRPSHDFRLSLEEHPSSSLLSSAENQADQGQHSWEPGTSNRGQTHHSLLTVKEMTGGPKGANLECRQGLGPSSAVLTNLLPEPSTLFKLGISCHNFRCDIKHFCTIYLQQKMEYRMHFIKIIFKNKIIRGRFPK